MNHRQLIEAGRRHGRTAKMLDEIFILAKFGHDIDIIAAHASQALSLYDIIVTWFKKEGLINESNKAIRKIRLFNGVQLTFWCLGQREVDMRHASIQGRETGFIDLRAKSIFVADHFAIQTYLSNVGGWAWQQFLQDGDGNEESGE